VRRSAQDLSNKFVSGLTSGTPQPRQGRHNLAGNASHRHNPTLDRNAHGHSVWFMRRLVRSPKRRSRSRPAVGTYFTVGRWLLENTCLATYNSGAMSHPLESDAPDFETIETLAVVGVGLIGGSIARAAKARGLARTVVGVGRNLARLEEARRRGVIDEASVDLLDAARHAGLLIFCTPVDRIAEGVRAAADVCPSDGLITDAGSVKGCICRVLARRLPRGVEFVGSHPLAGSERQGFEHADAQLFENRVCVVTPVEASSPSAVARVKAFWKRLGATIIEMTPEAHDAALAETSHLPHLVAAALAGSLSAKNKALVASGFRDTTRIASGDSELWSAILLGNRDEVLASLSRYDVSLARFRQALEQNDATALKELLNAAKMKRASFVNR
jgi:prephenate dehydrogenase